jgi:hypothetical protein
MTLVIARKFPNSIQIVSDTKLSFDDHRRTKHIDEDSVLKCVVLSPTCCVAFANDSQIAMDAIAPLLSSNSLRRVDVRAHLLDHCRKRERRADFILATSTDRGSIDHIRDGEIYGDRENAWIGEQGAFEEFQSRYLAKDAYGRDPGVATETDQAAKMRDALESVIASRAVPSVGGYTISTISPLSPGAGRGFRYVPNLFGSGFQPVSNTTEPTSMLRSVGVPGGSFNYAILVPDAAGVGAIGIYILEIRLGALFFPARSQSPIVYRDKNCPAFIESVKQDYGLLIEVRRDFFTLYGSFGALERHSRTRIPVLYLDRDSSAAIRLWGTLHQPC